MIDIDNNDDDNLVELLLISIILECLVFVTKSYSEVCQVLLEQQIIHECMLNCSLPMRQLRSS